MKTLLMRICFLILIIGSATVHAAGVDTRVTQELATTGQAKTIIALNIPDAAPSRLRASRAAVSRDPIGETQEIVLNDLPAGSYELTYQYSHVPGLAMTLTPASFEILKDHPQVKYIQFDELEHIALTQATTLINANQVWALNPPVGITGAGVTVAVLDTGIKTTHSDFSGKIQVEQCFLSAPAICPTPHVAEDGNGHGSHVSGIVAANGTNKGVAPGAKIAAVKVCNNTGGCQVSDTVAGLDWLLRDDNTADGYATNHAAHGIKIVNISIASTESLYSDSCENDARKAAIDSLISARITVFVAAGNKGNNKQIGAPACLNNVIAVGATLDNADTVWSGDPSSNSNKLVDIFAPGVDIASSGILNDTDPATKSGTSMATPMASGVAALMLQKNPNLTPALIKAKLQNTGVPVTDNRNVEDFINGIIRPRIDALAAVNAASDNQVVIDVSESSSIYSSNNFSVTNNVSLVKDGSLDFEMMTVGESVKKSIKIRNLGSNSLSLNNLTYKGSPLPNNGVSLVTPFPTNIAANSEANFEIKLEVLDTTNLNGILQFTTDDPLVNTFQLKLNGKTCPSNNLPFPALGVSEGFESGKLPDCWQTVNVNEDQSMWVVVDDEPSGTLNYLSPLSGSYSAAISTHLLGSLGNDWIIFPKITLGNSATLKFKARTEWVPESFNIKISTTGYRTSDFTTIYNNETVTATTDNSDPPELKEYNLSNYVGHGQSIYLAIQSIAPSKSNNNYALVIDDISVTIDNSPPNYQNSTPTTSNITTAGFDLTVRLNEMGKVYYVVLPANSSAPSNAQVKDGTGAVARGSIGVTAAGNDFSKTISGLSSGTAYKVYVVAEDISSNLQATATPIDVTTTAPVIPPPVVTPTPTPAPPSYTVIERKDGTGSGRITSIYVGQSTWTPMAALSATPDPGSVFVKWTGNTHSQDCYSDQPTIYVRLNAVKTCTATFDQITADNQSLVPVKLAAYYLPGRENSGKALIRITNTNLTPVEVKGTLYHASGQMLGIANSVIIPTLAPQATVELSTIDLAKSCSAPAWTGLAWLHFTTPTGLKLLNLLENDNTLISNFTSPTNDNTLYNLPASTSAEQANIVLINTSDKIQPVIATLYADSGQILGKANTILADVAARGIFTLSIKQLELLVDTVPWTNHVAKLQITSPLTEIKAMATLLSNDATVMNLTPTHDNAAFNVPGATNLDQAFVYVSNTTNSSVQVQATLYHQDGYLLGNSNTILANTLAPQATQLFSVSELERIFNVPTWQKRARLMITSPTTGIKVMTLIRNSSGVSNISAVTTHQAFYLPNATDADKAYVRMINLTDLPVTVTGVAYAENGQILGSGILTQLAAQTTTVLSMPLLESYLKITSWNGKIRLVISPAELQIMGTIRSNTGQLVDMSDVIGD